MSDLYTSLLLEKLPASDEKTLVIADENCRELVECLTAQKNLEVITNRYDIFLAAQAKHINCSFSDFDFSNIPENSVNRVLYRVSKERPVSHHAINQAFKTLNIGGKLIITGAKNEGIKGYATNAAKLFADKPNTEKHGNLYRATIEKRDSLNPQWLQTKDYPQIRSIFESEDLTLCSKPGVFGWNKIDQGSRFLIEVASDYLAGSGLSPKDVLDLGCGYGFLVLKTANWPFLQQRWATDNNAAAIRCVKENARLNGIDIEVHADDCASHINRRFELILCNPPFHQGFDVDRALTLKFLQQTHRHLASGGLAMFVVNRFIPIVKLATSTFGSVEEIASDGSFKVYVLKP